MIKELTLNNLKHTFRRLKKTTRGFSDLIVRDIFDHIDYSVNKEEYFQGLINEIYLKRYKPQIPYFHESPKSKGINRPTAVLSIEDMIVYRFCIENIEKDILRKVRSNPNIHGGMMIMKNYNGDNDGYYEKWFEDWDEHNKNLVKSISKSEWVVFTDIASYFENINILVLKDRLRNDVKNNGEVLDLLLFFLENFTSRDGYSVNTNVGLIQENIDCSRLLAYYFLAPLDDEMFNFAKKNDCKFYRYADDMAIIVHDETQGKISLKTLTAALRKLNLVASIQKTAIVKRDEALNDLFCDENGTLDKFTQTIEENIIHHRKQTGVEGKLSRYFEKLNMKRTFEKKHGAKLYKRFFTLFTVLGSSTLVSDFATRIKELPVLYSEGKILKYAVALSDKDLNILVVEILNYMRSAENLYPQLETNLLETIILVLNRLDTKNKNLVSRFSKDLFWHDKYSPLSSYSKCLALLLLSSLAIGKAEHTRVVNHYLTGKEDDPVLKKYMIAFALCHPNKGLYNSVWNKCSRETDTSIQRFVTFLNDAKTYMLREDVKKYRCKGKSTVLYYNQKKRILIQKGFVDVRGELLDRLISLHC